MESLWALVVGALGSALVVELYLWLPVLTEKLLYYNAARLPAEISSQVLEQWQADFGEFPSAIVQFLLALDLIRGRWKIIHAFYAPQVEFCSFTELSIRILSLTYAVIRFWVQLPCMLLAGLLIKLYSPGPIFLRIQHIGQGGLPFTSLKFRTLDYSSERPQLTVAGYLLEMSCLAIGPLYILNILKGDINVIGPIGFQRRFTEKYELEKLPNFAIRYAVKPGFISFAQICATKEDTPKRTIRYDAFYIKKRKFWLDLRLIIRTLWNVSMSPPKRQWKQRVLPPLSKDAERELTVSLTLIVRFSRYLKGMKIIFRTAYFGSFLGCWIYAIETFGSFWTATVALSLPLLIAFGLLTNRVANSFPELPHRQT